MSDIPPRHPAWDAAARRAGVGRAARRDREIALRRSDAIAAALAVFARKGFDGAQMTEIASAAEISLASLYSLFSGKDDLYREVLLQASASIRTAVEEGVAAKRDPKDKLLAVIDSLFDCFAADRDALWIHARTSQGLPWKIRQALGARAVDDFRGFTEFVAELVRDVQGQKALVGFDAHAVAAAILGAVTNAATQWAESPEGRSLEEVAAPVRALFERAVEPGGTQ